MDWLFVISAAVMAVSALWMTRERRRLERALEDPVVFVHFELEDADVVPLDVISRQARMMRANATWN